MKSSLRLVGVTLLTGGLTLGGAVLSTGAASADTGLKVATSMSGEHWGGKDDSCTHRHDYTRGHEDAYGRYHPGYDHRWLDDNCNLRSDDDYNGHWTDRNGCVHDYWGWWSKDGRYNWYKGHDDRDHSKAHDDGHHKSDNHKPGKKS